MNSVDILWVERHRWVPPMRGTSSTMWSSGCWSCRSCGMYSKTWRKSWTGRNGLWNWPLFPLAPPGTLSICLWCSLGGVSGRLISNFGSPFGECSSIFVLSINKDCQLNADRLIVSLRGRFQVESSTYTYGSGRHFADHQNRAVSTFVPQRWLCGANTGPRSRWG